MKKCIKAVAVAAFMAVISTSASLAGTCTPPPGPCWKSNDEGRTCKSPEKEDHDKDDKVKDKDKDKDDKPKSDKDDKGCSK